MRKIHKVICSAAAAVMLCPLSITAGRDVAGELSTSDAYAIEKMAMAEAEGEDATGRMLVMRVILNRVESPDFPDAVSGVISESGAFASYANGRYQSAEPDIQCVDALEAIQTGRWDESQGALYFEAVDNADPWHRENLRLLYQHGNHLFYK